MVISQPGEQSSSNGSPVVVTVTGGEELEGPSMETSSPESSGKRNAGDKKNKYLHLKEKHLSYPAYFKAQVIHNQKDGMTPVELVEKYSTFRLDEPKICRWIKQKEAIIKVAVGKHRNLFKIPPARTYINLYAELLKVFTASRGKGHRVDFNWLWSKDRNVYRAQEGQDAGMKKHVVINFVKRHYLKYRRLQRNKKKSKEEFLEKLVKWYATLRERLVRTGAKKSCYEEKWGCYNHHQRLNIDQSLLAFVI